MTPAKKEIVVQIPAEYFDLEYLSIDDSIKTLEGLKKHEADYSSLHFQSIVDCGCYGSCNCPARLRLFGSRLENDAEFHDRVKRETAAAERQLARDKAEFERLAKQFGTK